MRVLRNKKEDGYLDQAISEGWVRIQAVDLRRYALPDEQFFVRTLNIRFVVNYLREIGFRDVARKIRSRMAERIRNERCMVVGLGRVLESRAPSAEPGSLVPFIVPDSGPPSERYVVRSDLVGDSWRESVQDHSPNTWRIVTADISGDDPRLAGVAGWSPWSGMPLRLRRTEVEGVVGRALKANGEARSCSYSRSPVKERTDVSREPGLTVFGYGNYAKTILIPELGSKIPLRCVHEIDPWQIGRHQNQSWSWDTSPNLRPDEHPDVVAVAGFHHMHVDVAVEAIKQGARAVIIEKPIATTANDLEKLSKAIAEHDTSTFVAFQRRYSPFNKFIWQDLGLQPGEPVSCFASAYEVPLPPRHWYGWPNSGSPIISNGCHWIDHFLYLNSFCPVRQLDADRLGNSSIVVRIVLDNDAALLLSLTHEGSPRLGVRDHCEFRGGSSTAKVVDSEFYISESRRGVTRKLKTHRLQAHRQMYRSIAAALMSGRDGDSMHSIWHSANTVLAAEADLM